MSTHSSDTPDISTNLCCSFPSRLNHRTLWSSSLEAQSRWLGEHSSIIDPATRNEKAVIVSLEFGTYSYALYKAIVSATHVEMITKSKAMCHSFVYLIITNSNRWRRAPHCSSFCCLQMRQQGLTTHHKLSLYLWSSWISQSNGQRRVLANNNNVRKWQFPHYCVRYNRGLGALVQSILCCESKPH